MSTAANLRPSNLIEELSTTEERETKLEHVATGASPARCRPPDRAGPGTLAG